ncbi:Kinesin light chain 2 [Madurella mycetomatis]|uniref:Kinesin light chain 2 n=1 Tax=Madurella mycetomatis TaxID=100816 RepID=A0A175VZ58_9PEZI|nr:Kinesin light chain 2 [Madurella mycetomatis]
MDFEAEPKPPSSRDCFEVAIVCALGLEFDAAVLLLDSIWDEDHGGAFEKAPGDLNTYINGRIGRHNVVLVCLPQRIGKASAATVASDLRHSYRSLRLVLLVGICGGIPMAGNTEILLGDVVISSSIVQYDFGRQYPDNFSRKDTAQDSLNGPNKEIKGLLTVFGTDYGRGWLQEKATAFLRDVQGRSSKYQYPGAVHDKLFRPDYHHKHQILPTCECKSHEKQSDAVCRAAIEASCKDLGCDESFLVERARLKGREPTTDGGQTLSDPIIHIGLVASGDTVIKSAVTRDRIASKEGVIAFEMEAAGMWEYVPCLVVKGVCDYADSHKNKMWQHYAAATAASVAKAMLMRHIPVEKPMLTDMAQRQWVMPFPPDAEFVDRPDILTWVSEKSNLPGARVALVGLGGIGKSQLAIQFAHRVRRRSHVFWINATTQRSFEESYQTISDRLGLGKPEDSVESILHRVSGWLGREENGRWTIVLDNYDDESIFASSNGLHLTTLLPQTETGFTLITSRSAKAAERLTGSAKNIFAVPTMSEEGSLELFRAKLKGNCTTEDGHEVVRLLDYIPLAISQAAAYINCRAPRVSVRDYAQLFRSSDERKKVLLNWDYHDTRRYHDASNSTLGTWAITFDQVQRERPSAIDLLSFMSFFNPQAIPEWVLKDYGLGDIHEPPIFTLGDFVSWSASSFLSHITSQSLANLILTEEFTSWFWARFQQGHGGNCSVTQKREPQFSSMAKALLKELRSTVLPLVSRPKRYKTQQLVANTEDADSANTSIFDEEYNKDLDILLGYSLVTTTTSKGVLKVHPLVRYCTQDWLSRSGSSQKWKIRFLMVMGNKHPAFWTPGTWSQCRELAIHVQPITEEEPEDRYVARIWTHLCLKVAGIWTENGQIRDAAELFQRLVSVGDRLFGEEDIFTLSALRFHYQALIAVGQLEESVRVSKQHADRARGQRKLARRAKREHTVILDQLRIKKDLEKARRAVLEERRHTLGEHADDTLQSLVDYASVLTGLQRCQEASHIITQLLEENWAGRGGSGYQEIMSEVAAILAEMGSRLQRTEIEPLLRGILDVFERVSDRLPAFKPLVFTRLYGSLAECLEEQGKSAEAERVLRRGMQVWKRRYPNMTFPIWNLVWVLVRQRKYEEAEREYLESIKSWGHLDFMESVGPCLTDDIWRFAHSLRDNLETENGTQLLEAACSRVTEILGETHETTIRVRSCYEEWANMYCN